MPWSNIQANLTWWDAGQATPSWAAGWPNASGISGADKARILTALEFLYNNSATAAGAMDSIVSSFGALRISGGAFSFAIQDPIAPFVAFDVSEIDALYYFNETAQLVREKFELSLAHELFHITPGFPKDVLDVKGDGNKNDLDFNTANYDHNGQVLPLQTTVAVELGWSANKQISYGSCPFSRRADHRTGRSLLV